MSSAPTALFAPSLLEKLFALRAVSPFDRLAPAELALIAEIAEPRAYAPGETIHADGDRLLRLVAVVGGRVLTSDGTSAGTLLGAASLVRNALAPHLVADPIAGARVLRLERGPFFTLLRECPAFTLGLLELGATPAPAPAPLP